MNVAERIVRAFPRATTRKAEAAGTTLASLGATLSPDDFTVIVEGEPVTIPERLYVGSSTHLVGGDPLIACLFTRHHDGFVRQRALERVIPLETPWALPFIVRLVGEYVIEIVEQIDDRLSELSVDHLRAFVEANPQFLRLTRARVVSYWNCYYRNTPRKEYAGFRLIDRIEAAGR
jgi:hypothetical protein